MPWTYTAFAYTPSDDLASYWREAGDRKELWMPYRATPLLSLEDAVAAWERSATEVYHDAVVYPHFSAHFPANNDKGILYLGWWKSFTPEALARVYARELRTATGVTLRGWNPADEAGAVRLPHPLRTVAV